MNDLYLRLGRAIAGQCPTGFAEARLEAEYEEDRPTLKIVATMDDGTEFQPGLGPAARHDIGAALAEVRQAMAAEDGKPWRTCTVTLVRGGGFAMDVGY